MRYPEVTPPKPATFIVKKSRPRRTSAIAHAGICIGSGNSMKDCYGFVKISENMIPLRIASFP